MGMDRQRPIERFLPLRPVEFDVLLSLAMGERHGYGIIQDAEARGFMAVPEVGTLYRALRRMPGPGLLAPSARRDSRRARARGRGGRPRGGAAPRRAAPEAGPGVDRRLGAARRAGGRRRAPALLPD